MTFITRVQLWVLEPLALLLIGGDIMEQVTIKVFPLELMMKKVRLFKRQLEICFMMLINI